LNASSDQPPSTNPSIGKVQGLSGESAISGSPASRTAAARTDSPAQSIPGAAASKNEGGNSTIAVVASIIGDISVGVVKLICAALTGSQAMVSEGIHSIVDSGNAALVLLGIHQSKKGADEDHPFGHGKELYFWTLVVAVLVFTVGGGISFIEGVNYIQAITPETQLTDPLINIIVIAIAACIEGTTLGIAVRQFNKARGDMGPIEFIRNAKDPSLYSVVLEDTAAEIGLALAFFGVTLSHVFDNAYIDGIASILISLLLMAVGMILLLETRKLLVGEGLNKPETRQIIEIVESNPHVVDCGRVLTMYMGPHQLLVTIDANFSLTSSAMDILLAVDDIEANIRREFPDATRVFIEVESLRNVRAQAQAFEEMESEAEEELEREERENDLESAQEEEASELEDVRGNDDGGQEDSSYDEKLHIGPFTLG
jgi:cation diffusion facilitator family transporter